MDSICLGEWIFQQTLATHQVPWFFISSDFLYSAQPLLSLKHFPSVTFEANFGQKCSQLYSFSSFLPPPPHFFFGVFVNCSKSITDLAVCEYKRERDWGVGEEESKTDLLKSEGFNGEKKWPCHSLSSPPCSSHLLPC